MISDIGEPVEDQITFQSEPGLIEGRLGQADPVTGFL